MSWCCQNLSTLLLQVSVVSADITISGKQLTLCTRRFNSLHSKVRSIVNYWSLTPLCQHRIAGRSVAKIQWTRVINACIFGPKGPIQIRYYYYYYYYYQYATARCTYQVATALDRFFTIGAKVLGIFVLKEWKFRSRERKCRWTKSPTFLHRHTAYRGGFSTKGRTFFLA